MAKITIIIQDKTEFLIVNTVCNFDLFLLQLQLLTDATEEYQVCYFF